MEFLGLLIPLTAITLPIWIVWIVLHYKSKSRELGSLNADEAQQLEELNNLAEQLAERIKTLETILDSESPEWREHHAKEQ
ncbi:MAG: envelope stress response membrane protein PspB [Gammaproteobacteria bacterium]|nr:envelope stress response membrane protein PspB [Gammaproteobacteria bacterium]MAY01570.1 envelope stress response membrane protein PspB [Gammaproteobacteria bacterium]|tara:strand:+ start:1678 stop:1920 length:243 start_codon:yes stop_codon:yes gene_type:complete